MEQTSFKERIGLYSTIALVCTVFLSYLFGTIGVRFMVGILAMAIPTYMILSRFNLSEGEEAVFSLLAGFTLFPSLAYLIGYFISFTISIFLIIAVFIIVFFAVGKIKKT